MESALRFFCDFDGTITKQDSLKLVLDRFASPTWRSFEKAIHLGSLPEVIALQKMMDLMRADFQEVLSFVLDQVEIDSTFAEFLDWTREHSGEVFILSGGFIEFIRPLLRREGLDEIPVFANSISVEAGRWKVMPRQFRRLCETQTHCKCASAEQIQASDPGRLSYYIGDGHTDFCPARRFDLCFAKSALAEKLSSENMHFAKFENFGDVMAYFEELDLRYTNSPTTAAAGLRYL